MNGFALTSNLPTDGIHINDLFMNSNGQLGTITNNEDILQSIKCALQLWLGEFNYDNTAGVAYQIILGSSSSANKEIIQSQLIKFSEPSHPKSSKKIIEASLSV